MGVVATAIPAISIYVTVATLSARVESLHVSVKTSAENKCHSFFTHPYFGRQRAPVPLPDGRLKVYYRYSTGDHRRVKSLRNISDK